MSSSWKIKRFNTAEMTYIKTAPITLLNSGVQNLTFVVNYGVTIIIVHTEPKFPQICFNN